jgi:hypothetical protein
MHEKKHSFFLEIQIDLQFKIEIEMRTHKALSLLKSLSRKEIKDFQQYLEGLHGKKRQVISLFYYLKEHDFSFDSDKFFKTKNFKIRAYNGTLNNLMSDLTLILNDFLVFNDTIGGSTEREIVLAKAYQKRGISLSPHIKHTSVCSHLKIFDADEMLNCFLYQKAVWESVKNKISDKDSAPLQKIIGEFSTLFLILRAKLLCEAKIKNLIWRHWEPLDAIETYTTGAAVENDLLAAYTATLDLIDHPTTKGCRNIIDLLIAKHEFISGPELATLLNHVAVCKMYVMNVLSEREERDFNFLIDFSKICLKLFSRRQEVDTSFAIDIINMALHTGGGRDFIEFLYNAYMTQHSRLVDEDCICYFKCILDFKNGDFNGAFYWVTQIHLKDPYSSLNIRALSIMCTYEAFEKGEATYFALIESQLDSFEKFLRRSMLNIKILSAYLNFVKYAKILLFPTTKGVVKIKEALLVEPLPHKDWILEKIEIAETRKRFWRLY